jgi:hypothetical protein
VIADVLAPHHNLVTDCGSHLTHLLGGPTDPQFGFLPCPRANAP